MSADAQALIAAAERLRRGGVVAFPTETVYGLGADALNAIAVRAVFALKGRPANNPLIVHVADQAMARRIAAEWPRDAEALARRFWPGPLTLVLTKRPEVTPIVTGGGPTVAIRCPDHPMALDLIRAFGGPIVGPSANRSGMLSPTTAAHVRATFHDEIARDELALLDGGPCREGIESTVISLADATPRILRPGVIAPPDIESMIGRPLDSTPGRAPADPAAALPGPGMLDRHYAPRSPARLFVPADWPEVLDEAPGPAVVLTHSRARLAHTPHTLIRLPIDPAGYAAALYAALHEADSLNPSIILIEQPIGEGPVWDAVRDRLTRACT